jgi:hypothetical protein
MLRVASFFVQRLAAGVGKSNEKLTPAACRQTNYANWFFLRA